MKQPIKLLLVAAAAGSVPGLAFYGWSVKAKDNATIHFANGIDITPIEVKSDDTAQALEIRTWKYDVVQPDASKPLYINLSLCKEGKFVKTIMGGVGSGPIVGGETNHKSLHSQVTLSLVPIGNTFMGAHQLKYLLRTGSSGADGIMANPLLKGRGEAGEAQADPANNRILVMGTNTTKPYVNSVMSSDDVVIALNLSSNPPQ